MIEHINIFSKARIIKLQSKNLDQRFFLLGRYTLVPLTLTLIKTKYKLYRRIIQTKNKTSIPNYVHVMKQTKK